MFQPPFEHFVQEQLVGNRLDLKRLRIVQKRLQVMPATWRYDSFNYAPIYGFGGDGRLHIQAQKIARPIMTSQNKPAIRPSMQPIGM
jgi:hypothetical protein